MDDVSRNADDVTRVEWRQWGPAAFEEARTEDALVLLSLTAAWCDPCREMDVETYAEPRIAANVNDDFVPVRVDADRRPRVRDRYAVGGFPSTVFLTPEGLPLTGAGYLGPEAMRQVLDSVRERWRENGDGAARVPRALREDEPPAGELTADVERRMAAALEARYDEVAGGWGDGPKFPLPDALEFALKRDREMALRSFDAVGANLLDEHEGGFYRFASGRDWSGIHHEKLLDENAALVRAFANAYLYTGRERYLEPAERTIEYLTTTLWLPDAGASGAFAGSQAPGDAEAYTLDASDREAAGEPPIDDAVYAGRNALAVEALLTVAAYTDDERARRYAERALRTIRADLLEDGRVVHFRALGPDDGEAAVGERCLLANQARVLRALTTAWSVLGGDSGGGDAANRTEGRGDDSDGAGGSRGGGDASIGVAAVARAVADATIDRLRDGDSFVDGPADGQGLLSRPLRPLDANVELADALVDLAALADEPRYRTVAREALAAFAGASDRFGVEVARYGSVAARLLGDPLVIRVSGPPGSDLHRVALRVADHEKVVVPNASREEIWEDAPDGEDATGTDAVVARVERGDRTSRPATTPDELSYRVRDALE